jgi:hypothetical protein
MISFLDLVIVEFLQVLAHAHGTNSVPGIKSVEGVTSCVPGKLITSCETPVCTGNTYESINLVGK